MQELGTTEYLIPLRFEGPNTTWDGHNTIGLLSKSEKDRTVTDISMSASIWLFFQHFFASRGQGCSNSWCLEESIDSSMDLRARWDIGLVRFHTGWHLLVGIQRRSVFAWISDALFLSLCSFGYKHSSPLWSSLMLYRHLLPAVFSCSSSCGEHRPRFLSNLNRPVPSAWATSMARWLPSLALNMSYPNIDPDSKPFLIVSSLYFFHVSFLHI